MRPQPWHDEARRLYVAGHKPCAIGKMLNVCQTACYRLLRPDYRLAAQAACIRSQRERYANDPAFRARLRLHRTRKYARAEAVIRGVTAEEMYRLWECEL